MTKTRQLIITTALPYANGDIHLGHLLEYIQADIWHRYHQLRDHQSHYICGSDGHGTAIMLHAEKKGIAPEVLIEQVSQQQLTDFHTFDIHFDNFSSSHNDSNRQLVEQIFAKLQQRGDIETRLIEQAYDPEKHMFLPDRFIKGDCPKCGTPDQYGDNCEKCGATYNPTELKNARSVVSGATPILKTTDHYFFRLDRYTDALQAWTQQGHLQTEVRHKLQEWFDTGLQDWNISRDAPYFGFKIPGSDNKYFYVWLDAPICYMASFKEYCDKSGNDEFDHYWQADSSTELYHFIGKDIAYFHCLFWPAMLMASNLRTPTNVIVHGMLTVNGEKMSKSRGTFIKAATYAEHLNPEYLRYYYAAKLSRNISDIDLNLDDFRQRVNADLVGKFINIASRCAGFITKLFDGQLAAQCDEPALYQRFTDAKINIADLYEQCEYSKVVREIMTLADAANRYIDEAKPWVLAKTSGNELKIQAICTLGLNLFRILMTYLKPILPATTEKVASFLNTELRWDNLQACLLNHRINRFKPLLQRIEAEQINAMVSASQQDLSTNHSHPHMKEKPKYEPLADEITIDDFTKVDLRIAKIITAEHIEGIDKLLKLQLDIGSETRQVFAGIKSSYAPEQLVGKLTVMVANLKPRKMRFGLSEGMVLTADDEAGIYLLEPDSGAQPGLRVC